jgi:DNA-binding SARP family transcriptional activator/tetratricopeptide (TPR) repeat protein
MQEPSATMLELRVLGPLRLWRGGSPIALTNRKTQALLLVLSLDGGASRARLCALLWPDLDESSARRNLRRELARLREAGVPESFRADDDHLHPGDTLSCDLLLAEATPELALAGWPGELADGLQLDDAPQFAPWLSVARERALRLRLRALETAATAAEARADLPAALGHVQTLLGEDGLQERHHRQAMRLLAATGQREAALRQFERCQALLAADLGLAPMAETVALAQALRGAAPAALPMTAPSPTRPLQAWPERLPFVGRAAEVARLQGAWSRRAAVVVVGDAGVGKTRLATDFAASQGAYALVRCRSGDGDIAFGACARVLRVLAGEPPDLRGLDDWVVAEVARLLPELGPVPAPLRTQAEQLRFDEACIQAWLALSRGAFDALVLDDWQLADPASRTLLARTAARRREAGAEGAIELVCWRGASDDPELLGLSAALAAETVALGPLSAEAVYELVRQLSGAADPVRFADRLCSATGGHPYFISETLRDLAETAVLDVDEQGRWRTPFDAMTQDYRELPMPASVREAVLARVSRLDAPAARLLEAAALAGEPFGAAWLASACALSELEAVQALEQAARAQLVRAHAAGGYAWTHDLARQALDSALEPVRRRLVHHRLALGAEALDASAEAARHFEACGEPRRAVAHRLAAGDAARALAALGEAARHWQLGLADDPTPPQAATLLARLLEAEHGLGRHAEAEVCRQRLEDLRAGTALPPAIDVEAGHALARYLVRGKSAQAALALLDTLPPPGDDSQRLRRLSLRMDALQQHGRIDEARELGDEALGLIHPAHPERAELLASLAMLEFSAARFDAAVERADLFVTASRQRGDGMLIARSLQLRGAFLAERGNVDAAEVDLREAAALAGRFGNRPTQLFALYNLAVTFLQQTRPGDALPVALEGWALCGEQTGSEARTMFRALFIDAYFMVGDWGRAWAHIEPAIAEVIAIGQPMSIAGIAMAVLEPMAVLGQWPRAAALLAALDHDALAQSPQAGQPVWLACAVSALLRGEANEARQWLERLGPPDAIENPRVRQRLALVDAQRRCCEGDLAGALARLPAADAPGMNDELKLRMLAVRCRAGADTALLAQARAALSDPHTNATAALELAQALGGDVLAAGLERLGASLADWPDVRASLRATWL